MEKNERTIIFSDLFGTLISECEELCNNNLNYDDEFKILAEFLNWYLEGDNIFAIVSNPDHVLPTTYIEIFDRIVYLLEPEKVKRLYSIIRNSEPLCLISKSTGYKVNFYPMRTKADAPAILFSKIGINGNLISVGDNACDIHMLMKICELGGKSFFNINPLENTMAGHGIREDYNKFSDIELIYKLASAKVSHIESYEEYIKRGKYYEIELLEQYNSGNIKREQLIKQLHLLYIANLYEIELIHKKDLVDKSISETFEVNDFAKKCDKRLTLIHGISHVLPTLKEYIEKAY